MTTQPIRTPQPAAAPRLSGGLEFLAGAAIGPLSGLLVFLIVQVGAAPENVLLWFWGTPLLMLIVAVAAGSRRRWRLVAGQLGGYFLNIILAAYIGYSVCPVGMIRAGYSAFFGLPFWAFIGANPYAMCF
jgi:hypothetical protein